MHSYITVYKHNKRNTKHSVVSKPVASKQHAINSFENETNSLNTFTLLHCIKIVD